MTSVVITSRLLTPSSQELKVTDVQVIDDQLDEFEETEKSLKVNDDEVHFISEHNNHTRLEAGIKLFYLSINLRLTPVN